MALLVATLLAFLDGDLPDVDDCQAAIPGSIDFGQPAWQTDVLANAKAQTHCQNQHWTLLPGA